MVPLTRIKTANSSVEGNFQVFWALSERFPFPRYTVEVLSYTIIYICNKKEKRFHKNKIHKKIDLP
jgi:hypothetical protein